MAVAAVMAVGSLVATGVSTYMQYQGQREAARTAERVSDYNARLQENAAIQREMEAREQIRRSRLEGERFKGTQRVAIAKGGITTEGSPLEIMGQTAGELEMRALDSYRVAEAEKRHGFAQAGMTRWEGSQQAKMFRRQSTGTLLSGFANMSSQAVGFGTAGIRGFSPFSTNR